MLFGSATLMSGFVVPRIGEICAATTGDVDPLRSGARYLSRPTELNDPLEGHKDVT
jgi:hypothetical protein